MIQLLPGLDDGDTQRRLWCGTFVLEKGEEEEEEQFFYRIILTDEIILHLNVMVHNVQIWGLENRREVVERKRYSPKLNVFCAV